MRTSTWLGLFLTAVAADVCAWVFLDGLARVALLGVVAAGLTAMAVERWHNLRRIQREQTRKDAPR